MPCPWHAQKPTPSVRISSGSSPRETAEHAGLRSVRIVKSIWDPAAKKLNNSSPAWSRYSDQAAAGRTPADSEPTRASACRGSPAKKPPRRHGPESESGPSYGGAYCPSPARVTALLTVGGLGYRVSLAPGAWTKRVIRRQIRGLRSSSKEVSVKRIDLQLSSLTVSEKLDPLETIWADLSRDGGSLESPAWHEPILCEREAAFKLGEMVASDWGEAKKRSMKWCS